MMDYKTFAEKYLHPFKDCNSVYLANAGFIVWRLGTGNNVELLHIRAWDYRKGQGRQLVYTMLDRLKGNPPYYSIYGFTLRTNTRAAQFYTSLGFQLQQLDGVYKEEGKEGGVLFWQSYEELVRLKKEWEDARVREASRRVDEPNSISEGRR